MFEPVKFASLVGILVLAGGPAARSQSIELVSVSTNGDVADYGVEFDSISLSDDGSRIAFSSRSDNLVTSDSNGLLDVFVRDRVAGTTVLASVGPGGQQADHDCENPRISADGSVVVFDSAATNLVASDHNKKSDVFLFDVASGVTSRVSVDGSGNGGNGDSYGAAVSQDGRYVVFSSLASNLVAGDTNGCEDVFLRDRVQGTTTRVSVDSSGLQANGSSAIPAISRDGRFVVFESVAANLDPNDIDGNEDVYLRDTLLGTTTLVSVNSSGVKGDLNSFRAVVSDDGRYVAFLSYSDNLAAHDVNNGVDVFVRDVVNGTTACASVDSAGNLSTQLDLDPSVASISGDGRFVLFNSSQSDLVAGDANDDDDQFSHENVSGVTTLASVADDGAQGNRWSAGGRCSVDGSLLVFASYSTNLVAGSIPDHTVQAYFRTRSVGAASARNYGAGFPGTHGVPTLTASAAPTLSRPVDVTISNSLGAATSGLLVVGLQSAQIGTSRGGDLLVLPLFFEALSLPPSGTTLSGIVAGDETIAGLSIYLQALELDPGAAKGASFTDGLELTLGY